MLYRELDGEAVILNLETETYYGLNETATRMWALLSEGPRIEAVISQLHSEFDVNREELERDVLDLVEQLHRRSLVDVHTH